jgi:hypothetical protein
VRALLERDGVLELIGSTHIHDTIPQAVDAQNVVGDASPA